MFSLRAASLITLAVAGVLAMTLLAGGAAAQVPDPPASFVITVEATDFQDPIPVGEERDTTFQVTIAVNTQILCISNAEVPINLSVEGEVPGDGFTADVQPTTLAFALPTGLYNPTLQGFESDAQEATLRASLGTMVPRFHPSHTFKAVAEFDAGNPPAGCQSAGWGDARGEANIGLRIQHPPEENGDDGTNGSPPTTPPGDGGDDTNDGPGPALVLVLVGTLFAAWLRRRKA